MSSFPILLQYKPPSPLAKKSKKASPSLPPKRHKLQITQNTSFDNLRQICMKEIPCVPEKGNRKQQAATKRNSNVKFLMKKLKR